jgi:tRNA A37 threonylcarbamoyladenosine modification protein TsaB
MNNLILGINTATRISEIFLYDITLGQIIASFSFAGEQNEAEVLLPKILAMFNSKNRNLADLNSLVVVNGPGSFVALRVGVIIANTILNNLKEVEAYVLTTFDLLKYSLSQKDSLASNDSAEKLSQNEILIYAGGNQVFRQKNPHKNQEVEILEFDANTYKNLDNYKLVYDLPEKLSLQLDKLNPELKILPQKSFAEVFFHLIKNGLLDGYKFNEKIILPNYIKEPSITLNK